MSDGSPEGRTTRIALHRELYAEQAIHDAAETFAEYASFALTSKEEHFEVEVGKVDTDVQGDVIGEFCNFALANSAVLLKGSDV